MAIISAGYDGTVDEVQFASLLHRYSVLGADDFKATTQAGDRIVSIADGTAFGPGTVDVATGIPDIQFAAATGTRWDLVVVRRDWQPPGGATSVMIIEGPSTKGYPVVGTAATNWNRRPGVVDDQPLYLQEVNGTSLGTRVDLRCWANHGGTVAASLDARTYLERLGAELRIGGAVWRYVPGANNVPEWTVEAPAPFRQWIAKTQTTLSGEGGEWTISYPAGLFTQPPVIFLTKQTGAGAGFNLYHNSDHSQSTTASARLGAYWKGNTGNFTVTVGIHAVQASPTSSVGLVSG